MQKQLGFLKKARAPISTYTDFWDKPPTLGKKRRNRRPLQLRRPAVVRANGEIVVSSDDVRLGTALGRLCAHPKLMPFGERLEKAGEKYANLHRRARASLGLTDQMKVIERQELLTDDEQRRRKEVALKRLAEAEAVLFAIMPELNGRMYSLCVGGNLLLDHRASIVDGLIALSAHFKLDKSRP